jgi:predicted P-loop ATPase/GTPase
MFWQLKSGLEDTAALEQHIESLLITLGTKAQALRELWVDYDLTIQCVGYYPGSGHGANLNREVVRRAAQLGLAVDLDFYYVADPDANG